MYMHVQVRSWNAGARRLPMASSPARGAPPHHPGPARTCGDPGGARVAYALHDVFGSGTDRAGPMCRPGPAPRTWPTHGGIVRDRTDDERLASAEQKGDVVRQGQ